MTVTADQTFLDDLDEALRPDWADALSDTEELRTNLLALGVFPVGLAKGQLRGDDVYVFVAEAPDGDGILPLAVLLSDDDFEQLVV